jgi:hypothetical protein
MHRTACRLLRALTWLLACSLCLAQQVRIENLGPPFSGWVRTTIDRDPPRAVGQVGDATYVVGRQTGRDTHVVDLRVTLAAGEQRTVDLSAAAPTSWVRPPLPADPVAWAGGPMTLAGQPMQWVSLAPDGAGYLLHLRARTGRMFCVDVWATYYPGQAWAPAEALVTCSNPAVPDMGEATGDLALVFGDALTIVPGRGVGAPLVAAGTAFADGQARVLLLTFVWPRHLQTASEWSSVGSQAALGVAAVGIERLQAQGNPRYPPVFSARDWAAPKLPEAVRRLHTWERAVCGPNPRSADTGSQEDQVFVRGEMLLPGGAPAAMVTYLSAAKLANRPCNHLEADGSPMNGTTTVPGKLPILWNGRPHAGLWSVVDRRGKPTALAESAVPGGWSGPDVEHAFAATLFAGARATGSPALQQLLRSWATIYRLQWTTTPGWSTTQPYAARAVGWEGMLAVHLWDGLEDRELAAAVADHWRKRWDTVLSTSPRMQAAVWDIRTDDARLGSGQWWLPWQQAVGAYGLDIAGERFGRPAARAMALAAAKTVLARAWRRVDGLWRSTSQMPVDPARDAETQWTEAWAYFGGALGIATILRHEPQHEQARAIWQQLVDSATKAGETSWLAPEVQP